MRGRLVRFGIVGAVALTCMVAVVACGSNSTATSDTGGTLRIALAAPETSLDLLDFKTNSFNILDEIYEPLVRYTADGTIGPGLAESHEVSPDGLKLTFHLRKGVTFSDGKALTAPVAKADLQKWVGKEKFSFLGVSAHTKSITATDDQTLVLRLDKPYAPALQELAVTRPVRFPSPAAYGADGQVTTPIGTGPYRLQSLTPTEIVLVRNDTYWGGRPSLDKIEFKVIPDAGQRVAALKAGDLDLIGGQYLSPVTEQQGLSLKSDANVKVLAQPSDTNLLLAFNTTSGNPALADPLVREAINRAVDRKSYATTLFSGLAQPATQVFPPGIPNAPAAGTRDLPVDTEAAAALLDRAGWTGSGTRSRGARKLSLTLIVDPNLLPQATTLSQAVQADLAKVGVDVQITPLDSTSYADRQSKKGYDLKLYATYGPPYDPFSMLNSNFRTDSSPGLYASPAIDALIGTAEAATDPAVARTAYSAVWKSLNDAWAVAPLVELDRIWAVRTSVAGFTLGPTDYDLPLQHVVLGS